MTDLSPPRPPRSPRPAATAAGLVVAGAVALAAAAALCLWLADHVTSTHPWRVEDVVAPLVVTGGVLAATWTGVSALVAGLCAAVRATGGAWRAGERAVQRWAPGLVRRALAVAVAAGLGLTGAAGAHATTLDAPPPTTSVTVDLGWTPTDVGTGTDDPATEPAPATSPTTPPAAPTAPTAPAEPTYTADPQAEPEVEETGVRPDQVKPDAPAAVAPAVTAPTALPVSTPALPAEPGAPTSPASPDASVGTVEIRPGDTLWGLAARSLGPDASDAQIAAEWPRWYAANASTIGPDPDVLLPGQMLVVPSSDGGAR